MDATDCIFFYTSCILFFPFSQPFMPSYLPKDFGESMSLYCMSWTNISSLCVCVCGTVEAWTLIYQTYIEVWFCSWYYYHFWKALGKELLRNDVAEPVYM